MEKSNRRGAYGPDRCCMDFSVPALKKDCVHISGLAVEGRHPRALMESALVCLE